jgi:hypothetical protein
LPKAPQPWDLELCWDSASNASYQTLSQATKAACNTPGLNPPELLTKGYFTT